MLSDEGGWACEEPVTTQLPKLPPLPAGPRYLRVGGGIPGEKHSGSPNQAALSHCLLITEVAMLGAFGITSFLQNLESSFLCMFFFLQYLLENNRMVNIFTDLYYLTFVQELNKSLSTWQPTLLPNSKGQGPCNPSALFSMLSVHRSKSPGLFGLPLSTKCLRAGVTSLGGPRG